MATPQQGRKRTATGRDHEAIIDAHIPVGRCPKIDALFKRFLVKVLDKKPSEAATLCDYQIPHGKLESKPGSKDKRVLHVLHWPNSPLPPSCRPETPTGPAEFQFDSYTLKIVTDMFPDSEVNHVFTDYIPKVMKMKDDNGNRLTDEQLYGDLPHEEFIELVHDLIIEGDFDLVIVHGGPVRRALKKRLGLPEKGGKAQDYEMLDAVIGDKERTLTFLPHGKFIGRWADANVRKKVSDLLEGIHLRFDVPINIASLETRLKTREELKSITMPCHTPEELKLYKKEYANMWAGRKAWPGESEASRVVRHTKFKAADAAKQRLRRTSDVKAANAQAGKVYRTSEGGKAAIARAKPGRDAKAQEQRDKQRAANAQQPGETDEAFKERDRARKAEARKKVNPKKGEKQRAANAQQPGETDQAFKERDSARKARNRERTQKHRDKKRKAETLKGGQQQLGAFFKPSNVIATDTDEDTAQETDYSDLDEDAVANESDLDDVQTTDDEEVQ